MRRLPVPPRLARALLSAPDERTARLAVLLTERGLGGDATDLAQRERRWRTEKGERAKAAAGMARRWSEMARHAAAALHGSVVEPAAALALAHPDRIARARGPARPDGRRGYKLSSGRGAYLDASDPLATEEWLIACDLTGIAREQRIVAALPTSLAELEAALSTHVAEAIEVTLRDGRVEAASVRRLSAIDLERSRARADAVPSDAIATALAAALRERGIDRLPWGERSRSLRDRMGWVRARHGAEWPDTSDAALADALEEWLMPQLPGATRIDAVTDEALAEGLLSLLPWQHRDAIDRLAPARWPAPTGTRATVDYPADGGTPRLAIRVQELFGETQHPSVGGEPLLLDLLSPARRPIQTTADLPGFWAGSWAEVRRDMRARYPKHPWPEDPAGASPTKRTKARTG